MNDADGPRRPGAPVPVPVPAAPPAAGDVVRHGINVGLGAIGLARRAAGAALARTGTASMPAPPRPPSTVDLLPGAMVGLGILVERRVRAVGSAVIHGATGVGRAVGSPRLVQRALRPVEDALWAWNEVARREQAHNRAEAAAMLPVVVQQVAENVIAQLDFGRIVGQIPMADVAAQIDVEAIVARIDLAGVIRESTASVGTEAVDALREQGMALDAFGARVADRVLFRKRARELSLRETR